MASCQFYLLLLLVAVISGCRRPSTVYNRPFYMDDLCERGNPFTLPIDGAARIKPSVNGSYPRNMICFVILSVKGGAQMIGVKVRGLDMPSNCSTDRLVMYNGTSSQVVTELCGKSNESIQVKSPFRQMDIQLVTSQRPRLSYKGFDLIVTVYQEGPCPGGFKCFNGRCISRDLACDGYNNCGDGSDEIEVNCSSICGVWCGFGSAMIAALSTILIGLTLATIICLVLWFSLRHKQKLQHRNEPNTETAHKTNLEQNPEIEAVMRAIPTDNILMTGRVARSNPDGPN